MPNQDKTGPEGKGPMTGRGMGGCRRSVQSEKGSAEQLNEGGEAYRSEAPMGAGTDQDAHRGQGRGAGMGQGGRLGRGRGQGRGGRGGRGGGGRNW